MPANPFGRPYHCVWHRHPEGTWVFYGDTPTDMSCTRCFDAAISAAFIADSTAVLDGVDLGPPGPLPEQTRLGDFWLPQGGIFAVGESSYEEFDPKRHQRVRPASEEPRGDSHAGHGQDDGLPVAPPPLSAGRRWPAA
jgi:hypothetical protein